MSISERSRHAVIAASALLALAMLRCAPTNDCIRISDCENGYTCVSGACALAPVSSDVEGGSVTATTPSTSSSTSSATDSAAPVKDSSATTDAMLEAGDATVMDAGETEEDTADF